MQKFVIILFSSVSIITSAQNVGIGVANPQSKLHVGGGFRLDTLTGVGGAGLLRHDANGVVYGIKFSGNISDVLRGDGTFGSGGGSSLGWLLNGNSGTNPSTHFIGTTDNQGLQFRLNNSWAGKLDQLNNNYSIGIGALELNTTGTQNVAFGRWGLLSNTTGSNNTSIGHDALSRNTSGSSNTAIGSWAMLLNTTGARNTPVGNDALSRNMLASDNTAIGFNVLLQNTASQNTAVGSGALSANTAGTLNTATGYQALGLNQTNSGNSAFGHSALKNNQANYNSAFGSLALSFNTTGLGNSAFGNSSLYANTTGYDNTAIGNNSLANNNNGYFNSALGTLSLWNNSSGHDNTVSGYGAMFANTIGSFNTSIGAFSLNKNTEGQQNTAVGYKTLEQNRGFQNTGVGFGAIQGNVGGWYNSAFGYLALNNNNGTAPDGNSAFGAFALLSNSSGDNNTAIGTSALYNNISGSNNTAIGNSAGTGLPNNVFNVTVLGNGTGWNTTSSNQVNIGNFSVSWIGGQVGWFHYSDKRIKSDIKDDVPGLTFITRLRPITYHVDIRKQEMIANAGKSVTTPELIKPTQNDWEGKYDVEKIKMTGFFAQDVEEAARSINYSFSGVHNPKNGGLYSLDYSAFVVPLVKAVQEQQVVIDKQQKIIDDLLKRVEALEKK